MGEKKTKKKSFVISVFFFHVPLFEFESIMFSNLFYYASL